MASWRRFIVFFQLALLWPLVVVGATPIAPGTDGYESRVKPFFKMHCVKCHGPTKSKGGIRLHVLSGDLSSGQELEKWESVLDILEFGEMPPIDEPQPKEPEVQAVIKWIETGMREAAGRAILPGEAAETARNAHPATRRLTNVEFQNTLNELLGFELDVMDDLPEDPELHYGFNNTAELMRMGPEQFDRYLEIARKAMRAAIVDPEKPEPYRKRSQWSSNGTDRGLGADEVGVWGNRRGTAADGMSLQEFPRHGEYRIRMQVSGIIPPGFTDVPLKIDMGTTPGRTETPYKTVGRMYLINTPDEPSVFEFRGRIENHPTSPVQVGRPPNATMIDRLSIKPRIFFDDGTLNDGGHYANIRQLAMPRAVISWIEIEVPIVDVWPPRHHTDILFESPLRKTDETAYVRQVIERFMSRAYRRPANDPEIDKFATIFSLIRPSVENFEQAMRETLAMLMISPQFLYHTESAPATNDHFAMASKLSYFLWASMPDKELLDLAAEAQLNNDSVIMQQVQRLLADERSQAFVEDFTLQWLSIRKTLTVPINDKLYPRFLYRVPIGETKGTEVPYRITVRDFMLQETIGFVGELIRQNRSVLNVVDSDFACLNERLANHYGIEGVKGMQMRPVPIKPEDQLGGLLTHGSVLIGNGTGTAPHPIYRAVWLREAILGDHVPAPPSEVPALEETAGDSTENALSIAQLLARHRTVENCNDCHFRLDPWGIPFEDYNAIGRYQPKVPKDGTQVTGFNKDEHNDLAGYQAYLDTINTVEVTAKARVPHGPEIDGMRELKDYLLKERSDDIAHNVIRRLLAYSVGRKLTYHDRFAVDAIYKQTKDSDFKMRDIIVSICLSDVFRRRTGTPPRQ
jgi:mono/diheme cytochrome c family protein